MTRRLTALTGSLPSSLFAVVALRQVLRQLFARRRLCASSDRHPQSVPGNVAMICKSLLAITLALSISVSSTKAADDPYAAMQNFTKLTSKTINSAGCLVMGSADFDASKQYLPIFREEWLNRDYSLDFYVQRGKQVFLYMIVKRFAELITEGLYSHGGPPQCSFAISISYIDKLGQPKVLEAVTWQFTQKRASEVNWEKIDPRNFNEIALDYKFGPQVSEWTAGEPSFGPPSTPSASCDMRFVRANSIFIRATTYCAKDYMDSPAGYYALAMSRQCAQDMTEEKIKTAFMSAAKEIDDAAKKGGKAGACRFVDQVEREITRLAVP
jgi:hypothetical protein